LIAPFGALALEPIIAKRSHRKSEKRAGAQRSHLPGTLEMNALWIVIALGALSIVYGIVAGRQVMEADAGSQRMQEIAAAVREGAQAYLRRQYLTISAVGLVIFLGIGLYLG
jgi:Inorganic H+ pyrophosphatase